MFQNCPPEWQQHLANRVRAEERRSRGDVSYNLIDFICKAPEVLPYCRTWNIIYSKCLLYFFSFKDALCFDEAMISDTKLFFFCFFLREVHTFKFYIMHKSILKKKTFTKLKTLTMLHATGAKKLRRKGSGAAGRQKRRGGVRVQRG